MLPFEKILGNDINQLTPLVRDHFLQTPGVRRYKGRMDNVWLKKGCWGWIIENTLRIINVKNILFANSGENIEFELINEVKNYTDGSVTMKWSRTFYFPANTQRFDALMIFNPQSDVILDKLGTTGDMEVELLAKVEGGMMIIFSRRQWIKFFSWKLPLPYFLSGRAYIQEWENKNGSLGIKVTISNPLIGEFFGYEGWFKRVDE